MVDSGHFSFVKIYRTAGVGDGQGGLSCCDSWGQKELDTTEWLIWSAFPYMSQQSPSSSVVFAHADVYIFSRLWDLHRGSPKVLFLLQKHSVQFSSVAQSSPTLCDPMNCSMPGLPVHHQLPESTETHVHWVGDAIQLFHPLSSPSLTALNLS